VGWKKLIGIGAALIPIIFGHPTYPNSKIRKTKRFKEIMADRFSKE
jgi:hypothetical protein